MDLLQNKWESRHRIYAEIVADIATRISLETRDERFLQQLSSVRKITVQALE